MAVIICNDRALLCLAWAQALAVITAFAVHWCLQERREGIQPTTDCDSSYSERLTALLLHNRLSSRRISQMKKSEKLLSLSWERSSESCVTEKAASCQWVSARHSWPNSGLQCMWMILADVTEIAWETQEAYSPCSYSPYFKISP